MAQEEQKLPNFFMVINEMAKVVIDLMKEDYDRKKMVGNRMRRAVATGTLKNSLAYRLNIKDKNVGISVYAKGDAKNYYEVVEFGRGKGKTPPPTQAIYDWMRIKPIRLRNTSTGKFKKETDEERWHVARLIAKAIGRDGIPGRHSFDEAISLIMPEFDSKLSEAYNKDLNITLEKTFRK
jgi:hypothetical protein